MVGRPVLTSPPASEPICLLLVKEVLRIDAGDTSQDQYLNLLIAVARETAEVHTTRGYITQSYREYYDGFPGHHLRTMLLDGEDQAGLGALGRWGDGRHRHHRYFELSRSPLQVVIQVQYIDLTGTTQTLDPGQYVVNASGDPAKITHMPELLGGVPWPIAIREPNAVWIDYIVGYGGDIAVTTTVGSAVIASPYTFLASDEGRRICVPGAAAGATPLITTVQSVAAGVATLNAQAALAVTTPAAYLGNHILKGDTQAMLQLIAHWYENRTPVTTGILNEIPFGITRLLNQQRVFYQP